MSAQPSISNPPPLGVRHPELQAGAKRSQSGQSEQSEVAAAYQARLARLQDHAKQLNASALVSRAQHVRYLTGCTGHAGPAYLLASGSAMVLVAPSGVGREDQLAKAGLDRVEYRTYDPDRLVDTVRESILALQQTARRLTAPDAILLEADHLPIAARDVLAQREQHDLSALLAAWRTIKDPVEWNTLRNRASILDGAFTTVYRELRSGISELDLHALMYREIATHASEPLRLNSNLASGRRTALPDPHPTDKVLEEGDLVLVDLYPVLDGYVADCTRTFVVGDASPLQIERHRVVEDALMVAEALLWPGTPVSEIDRRLRDALKSRSEPEQTMPHHTGHGIGLFPWEHPWIGRNPAVLAIGNVVAIEPGMYYPNWGGIRIESNYLITDTGPERLDQYPYPLGASM